jgi:hypothetical protein
MHGVAIFLQAFVAASIFFVWGVRHSHVAEEFKTVQAAELAARFPGDSNPDLENRERRKRLIRKEEKQEGKVEFSK